MALLKLKLRCPKCNHRGFDVLAQGDREVVLRCDKCLKGLLTHEVFDRIMERGFKRGQEDVKHRLRYLIGSGQLNCS